MQMPSPIEVMPILILIVILALAINKMMDNRGHDNGD
jgi:hypothetical protein